jgi:hypothetical protein
MAETSGMPFLLLQAMTEKAMNTTRLAFFIAIVNEMKVVLLFAKILHEAIDGVFSI